jgi:hypothetical protein
MLSVSEITAASLSVCQNTQDKVGIVMATCLNSRNNYSSSPRHLQTDKINAVIPAWDKRIHQISSPNISHAKEIIAADENFRE